MKYTINVTEEATGKQASLQGDAESAEEVARYVKDELGTLAEELASEDIGTGAFDIIVADENNRPVVRGRFELTE